MVLSVLVAGGSFDVPSAPVPGRDGVGADHPEYCDVQCDIGGSQQCGAKPIDLTCPTRSTTKERVRGHQSSIRPAGLGS